LGRDDRMQTFSKKRIIILMVGVIIYSLFLVALVQFMVKDRDVTWFISGQWLSFGIIVGIILSMYTVVDIWRLPQRLLGRAKQRPPLSGTLRRRVVNPETSILLIFGGCLLAPDLYGLVLFFMGMPASEIYYFAGISIVAVLAWGIYNLRKSQEQRN